MIIRQSAFVEKRRMLKGALHCHTTRSDGKGTPEEVVALHEHNGYDFLAITDHRNYNFANPVPGSRLTILPGMEMDRSIDPWPQVHCFHSVWLGREKPHNPFEQDQRFEGGLVKDQHEYQKVQDEGRQNGQLIFLCHPQWSGTFVREFDQLKGHFAIELFNTGCALENQYDVNNGWIWDELLMQGQKIFGVAVDDGHRMDQHCRGWVMVNAENNVDSILDALKNGDFYASTGPEIYDFWMDDDRIAHVKCSPCSQVRFYCASRVTTVQYASPAKPITEIEFNQPVPDYFPYLRVEVMDREGRLAWSNPIFLKEEQA